MDNDAHVGSTIKPHTPADDTPPPPALCSEMRELRKVRGLTLKQVSKAAGISLSYLSMIERDAGNPSVKVLRATATALAVDINWFFTPRRGAGPMERASIVRKRDRCNLNLIYGRTAQEIGYTNALLSTSIGGRF